MAKKTVLPVTIDGTTYSVGVLFKKRRYHVDVDGVDTTSFQLSKNSVVGANEDIPVEVGGASLILAMRGSKMRLAHDGRYVDNGEEFLPATPFPKWYWVFFALNILIPIVSLGGALNVVIAFAGAGACATIVRGPKSNATKAILCTVTTAATWAVWFLLILVIANLMY